MFCLYFYYIYFLLLFRYFSKKMGEVVRPQMFTATKKNSATFEKSSGVFRYLATLDAICTYYLPQCGSIFFTISPLFDITSRHIELCNRVISHKE